MYYVRIKGAIRSAHTNEVDAVTQKQIYASRGNEDKDIETLHSAEHIRVPLLKLGEKDDTSRDR